MLLGSVGGGVGGSIGSGVGAAVVGNGGAGVAGSPDSCGGALALNPRSILSSSADSELWVEPGVVDASVVKESRRCVVVCSIIMMMAPSTATMSTLRRREP